MPITRVKICGITRPQDAALAAELGADAIGLNFVGGPRKITPHFAHRILDSLPPLVSAVALVNAIAYADSSIGPLGILDIALGIPRLRITHFQLYNVPLSKILDLEEPIECWPVFSIASRESFSNILMATHANELRGIWPSRATAVLLDTASEKLGGTGQTFNWNWIAEARDAGELNGLPPLILAGGLTPDNVADAIRIAKPYAVDVSSGVEVPGKPGIKDPLKLRDFIQAAKAATA